MILIGGLKLIVLDNDLLGIPTESNSDNGIVVTSFTTDAGAGCDEAALEVLEDDPLSLTATTTATMIMTTNTAPHAMNTVDLPLPRI